jgi:transcriptional regulator GlxA family with amidase domain
MQLAIGLFDGMTSLDAIGPFTVLASLPDTDVVFVAERAGVVTDDRGLGLVAHASFADVEAPDVIVVPGGIVTHRMVRDGHPVIDWIRAVHPTTTWTTSACTGALLLAAAGVLQGVEATTHWTAHGKLATLGARPVDERVVERGKVITSAGVSAGIDMALTLAARLADEETAQRIQLSIEYDPQPPFSAGSPATAPPAVVEAARSRSAEFLRHVLAD